MLHEKNNLASLESLESRLLMSSDGAPSVGGVPIGMGDSDQIYYVSPTGSPTNDGTLYSPWNTVEYALSRVGGGHTIILEPGTYAPFIVTQGGTADHPTVIQSMYKWQAVVDGTGYSDHNIKGADNAEWIIIDGVQSMNSAWDGVKLYGDHSVVENCWVHHSKGQGIAMHSQSYSSIIGNLIEWNGDNAQYEHGIYADGDNFIIEGNIVRYNASAGLHLYPSISNSVITNNLVYGQGGTAGVIIETGSLTPSVRFDNNTVISNKQNITLYGNTVSSYTGNFVKAVFNTSALDNVHTNNISDYLPLINTTRPVDVAAPTILMINGSYGSICRVGVYYSDDIGIDVSKLKAGGLRIEGSDGYAYDSASISSVEVIDAGYVRVIYNIAPPEGQTTWTSAYDKHVYSVYSNPQTVCDTALTAHFASCITAIGSFKIDIPATDTVPPTAQLILDSPVSGSDKLFARVIFRDQTAMKSADVNATVLRITGPNGFSQTVTCAVANSTGDSATMSMQYIFIAPDGSWDFMDNGHYTLQLLSDVHDTSGNLLSAGTSLSADINFPIPDKVAPAITLSNAGVSTFGVATRDFVVAYHDDSGVKASTIDSNDLTITGPNGFSQKASIVTTSVSADGTTVTATYRMTAQGGMWDAADNGNYQVSLSAGAVSDIYDNLTAGATIAQFTAAVLNAVPVLQSYGAAQAGSAYLSLTIKSATTPIPMLVKGPGGFSAQVQILNTVAGANGGYVSTCRVLAPGGTWDYADNGSYTVVPQSTVNLAAGNVGSFAVNLAKPAPAPTGTLLGVGTTPAGNTYVEITLSYYNGTAITPSSFVPDQVQLVGPNGYVRTGQIYSKGNLDSKHVSVTYRFTAPGGTWDYTDNGTYSLYKTSAAGGTTTVFGKITVKLATPTKTTLRATTDEQIAKTGVVSGPWQQTPVNILADIMPLRLRVA